VSGPVYQFGDFRLDCGAFELLRNGHSERVERKPMELLILLASRPGQLVTRTEIAKRLWSSEVFVDTEHGINTAVRKLRLLLHDDADSPSYIQTVTGLGYRFIATITHVSREPIETTNAPVSSTVASTISQAAPHLEPMPADTPLPSQPPVAVGGNSKHHRRLWIGVAIPSVLLVAAAVRFSPNSLVSRVLNRDSQPLITSIAVLPLNNLSGDPNQEYFADGMTDELITTLVKDSTLRVISRTSVMQYKGTHKSLPEIARALSVDGILEGSVTRTGDHVHLTLQLIRADTDAHLWANSYDRTPNDTVTLPAEAAREIARRLNSSVSGRPGERYVDPAAHDAYLHGLYLWYSSNEKAGEYFRKAVEIQPDYALGLTGVAAYYGGGSFEGELDPRDALPKAEAAAEKAIALDDSLPEAHSTMAAAVYAGRWDWKWSEREIRRAVELDPNFAEGWHLYAKMLGPLNRSEEAIAAQKKATELDPFARPWAMAVILLVARKFDASLADANMRSEIYPHSVALHWVRANCYRYKGMMRESVNEMVATYKDIGDPQSAAAVEHAFNHGGMKAVLRWHIANGEKMARKRYVSPVALAQLHAQLGEREPTLSLLEEGFRQHSPQLLWIQRDPEFDFLHSDPRFRSLVQRTGLPPIF